MTLLFSVIYSITDEAHQFLSDDRNPSFKDVVFDSAGYAVGIGISLFLFIIIARAKKLPRLIYSTRGFVKRAHRTSPACLGQSLSGDLNLFI